MYVACRISTVVIYLPSLTTLPLYPPPPPLHPSQETLEGVDVNVTNRYGSSLVPWRHYRLTHLDGYMLTMPDREEHTVDWLLPIGNE